MTKLYITRHGQTEWNVEGRIQGRKDSNLTELGEKQAKWLGEKLKDESIDLIISSSSGRAFRTAEIIRGNKSIEIIKSDALLEMNVGDWEGQLQSEIEEHSPEELHNLWNFPHLYKSCSGETYFQVMERVTNEIEKIIKDHKGRNVLVVTHAIALKAILTYIENKDIKDFWTGSYMHSTCLNIIVVEDHKREIILQGDISHYQEE